MKEVRLRYNDQEELQYLIIGAEAYMYAMKDLEDTTTGLESLRIFKSDDKKTGIKLDIAVRRTKTGIIIAEVRK